MWDINALKSKVTTRNIVAALLVISILLIHISCSLSNTSWLKKLDPTSEEGLNYIEDQIANQLEGYSDEYILEYVECIYFSKEYIDEFLYNSQSNIYFGYDYNEILQAMGERDWTFTVKNGKTVVVEVEDPSDALEQLLKKVAIGVGVIVVCAVISVASAGAGAAPVACFFAGAAKTALVSAVDGAVVGAAIGAIMGGVQSGSWEGSADGAIRGAGDGFLWGAISGALVGGFSSASCFTADTLVKTKNGYIPISNIAVGELVWAYHDSSDSFGYYPVTEVFTKNSNELILLSINDQDIMVTPEHPFLTDNGWVEAEKLQKGSRVISTNGYSIVENSQRCYDEELVFNLEVEDAHTYTVTEDEFVVHNRCNINSKYAGKNKQLDNPKLQKKYPNGVDFDEFGYARFEPYAVEKITFDPGTLTGKSKDFRMADKLLTGGKRPKGYTWHHVEDGRTLILVPTDIHHAVRHTGGASLLRAGVFNN